MTIDCQAWRDAYDVMSPDDQRNFYSRVWDEYPDQSHFSARPLAEAIERHQPTTVIELGGWDGQAAVTMLEAFSFITQWTNVEICPDAVRNGHHHSRYQAICPTGWYWDREWAADMFVGSHVIEHLRMEHLEAVIAATDVRVLYFEAPLVATPTDWTGTSATHILECGWEGVSDICRRYGYMFERAESLVLPPKSGGHSVACTFTRTP